MSMVITYVVFKYFASDVLSVHSHYSMLIFLLYQKTSKQNEVIFSCHAKKTGITFRKYKISTLCKQRVKFLSIVAFASIGSVKKDKKSFIKTRNRFLFCVFMKANTGVWQHCLNCNLQELFEKK